MRLWIALVAVMCGLLACSSSGSKSPNAGMARFVGTWESTDTGVIFEVKGDQKATLTLKNASGDSRVVKGTCFPGSDTLSFSQELFGRDKTGPTNYLFSTRPDGTLVVAIDGSSVRLTKR